MFKVLSSQSFLNEKDLKVGYDDKHAYNLMTNRHDFNSLDEHALFS